MSTETGTIGNEAFARLLHHRHALIELSSLGTYHFSTQYVVCCDLLRVTLSGGRLQWGVCVWCVQYSAYHVVAEGYGAVGTLLGRDNEDNMEQVLIDAQRTSRCATSALRTSDEDEDAAAAAAADSDGTGGDGGGSDVGRSVLVNCLIGRTSFRDGSISVWHLSFHPPRNITRRPTGNQRSHSDMHTHGHWQHTS